MTATTSNLSDAAALPDYAPVPPSALGPALNEVRGGGDMPRIAVILGSTRPGRLGEHVARWVMDQARHRTDAEFELVDLVDYPLPHLDEPLPPNMGAYQNAVSVLTWTWLAYCVLSCPSRSAGGCSSACASKSFASSQVWPMAPRPNLLEAGQE